MLSRFIAKPKITSLGPEIAEKVFSLLGVDPSENDNLRILDEVPEDHLVLIHYLEDSGSGSSNSPNSPNSTKDIRGVVIDTKRGKVVARSFPSTEEFVVGPETKDLEIPLNENCKVTYAYEGTILRLFCGKETSKWYLSTHKKINGYRSRWSGPTFGEMFDSVWGDAHFKDYLSPDCCYVFLLSHTDNRLVCRVSEPKLHHISTFESESDGKMKVTFRSLLKVHPNVKEREFLEVDSKEELLKLASGLGWESFSGLLVTEYKNSQISGCWKILSQEYSAKREIRGNEPNFRLRYYELRQGDHPGLGTRDLYQLFPEKASVFEDAESQLKKLLPFLAKKYTARYRKGQFEMLPKNVHLVLERTANSYDPRVKLEENLRISLEELSGHRLNSVVRFMIQEKRLSVV